MIKTTFTDERGRKFLVRQPDGVPDSDLYMCPVIGPPDIVDGLELPEEMATALHNRLYEMKLYTAKDVGKNPQMLFGALQFVLKISAEKLHHAYIDAEKEPELIQEV